MTVKPVIVGMILLVFAAVASAQGAAGSISGLVTDPSGAIIVGASVSARSVDTGIAQTVKTDGRGFYVFAVVPLGHYVVQVSQPGFKLFEAENLTIDVNTALRVDATLQVGRNAEVVEVSTAGVQIETTSTQMGEVIDGQQVTSMPLNGRSYTDLLALQPGVAPVTASVGNAAYAVSGTLNPGDQSISGQRQDANGFYLNGASVEEFRLGGTAAIPNLDSIDEFKIQTNNSDAEFGDYAGGLINVATKSGSNQFHGDVFEFLRNTLLDATTYFEPTVGTYIQNQFGGTVGGPIRRDKLFFFTDYQGTRNVQGVSEGEVTVASMADRTGNFADLTTVAKSAPTNSVTGAYWANQLSNQLGYTVQAGEPYWSNTCTSTSFTSSLATPNACVFPGGVIPASGIATPSKNIIAANLIPPPTGCTASTGTCYYETTAYDIRLRDDKGSMRVDENSKWGLLSAYYYIDDYLYQNPYGSVSLPGYYTVTPGRAQVLVLSDTKTLSKSTVNDFRVAYVRNKNTFNNAGGGLSGPTWSSLGFVTGAGTLGVVSLNPTAAGVPDISTGGGSIGTGGNINLSVNNSYQFIENFSKIIGGHFLKVGGSYYRNQVTTNLLDFDNGSMSFSGGETNTAWVDFLIGAPSGFTQGEEEPTHNHNYYMDAYAQDSWRVSPTLTLNGGLRWEVSPSWIEAHNEENAIDPGVQSVVMPGAPLGWVFPGDPGVPRTVQPTRWDDFGPRFGLAFTPDAKSSFLSKIFGGLGKSSIRASWGLYYTAVEEQYLYEQLGDAPWGNFYTAPSPPEYTTPYVTRATGVSEGQRFPAPYPPANYSQSNPATSVNWALYLPISGSPAINVHNETPYVEDWEFSVQRELPANLLLSISYVGTAGHRLLSSLESNPGNAALCLSLSETSEVKPGTLTCGPKLENDIFTSASGTVYMGTRQPLGYSFGSNADYSAQAYSNYNALEVVLRRTGSRLTVLGSYTYSKCLANSSDIGDYIGPISPRESYTLCSWDSTNNVVGSYNYELPFDQLSRIHNGLTRGWYFSGNARFSQGFPVVMGESDDRWLLGTSDETPNYTPGPLFVDKNPRHGNAYFNTSLFTKDALGSPGNSPLRFFHGPGIDDYNLALTKQVPLWENNKLQIRVEAFNAFNHAQFSSPSGSVTASTFGYVTSASASGAGRVLQGAAKITF